MKLVGLAVVRLVLESAHLDAESRVLVRGLHFLWQMKLKLTFKLLREACVGANVWRLVRLRRLLREGFVY